MTIAETIYSQAGLSAEEELWRQRVGGLTAVPRLLRELGVDPRPVLAAAGRGCVRSL